MKKTKLITLGLVALSLAFTAFADSKSSGEVTEKREISSYIRTWPLGSTPDQVNMGNHWTADDVKGEYLTDLIIAFAHVDQETWGLKYPDIDSPEHPFPNFWEEVEKLQAKYPELNMHLSVGGYGADGFSQMASDKKKRKLFINAVVDVINERNLQGIDIDWEYPIGPDWGSPITVSPDDGKNFVSLLKELRKAVDKIKGKDVTISIAVPASFWYTEKLDVKKIASYVDTVKYMAYDYYGDWSGTTGHHCNLYTNPNDPQGLSTQMMVNKYLEAGVPKEKLVVGLAFYGRAWKGVEEGPNKDGLFQNKEAGAYPDGLSWSDMGPFLAEGSGYTRYFDDVAKAPYLYNGDEFITYTDAEAIKYIGEYVKKEGLKGVMVWEYGHDFKCELFPVLQESVK